MSERWTPEVMRLRGEASEALMSRCVALRASGKTLAEIKHALQIPVSRVSYLLMKAAQAQGAAEGSQWPWSELPDEPFIDKMRREK